MSTYHRFCYGYANEDCARQTHKIVGINYENTMNCVRDQFALHGKKVDLKDDVALGDNNLQIEMIDHERDYDRKHGPPMSPAIVINNQTFRGQLEVEAVFNGICAGFAEPPRYCRKFLNSNDLEDANLIFWKPRKHSFGRVIAVVTFVMLTVALFFYCYRRSAKRAMKAELKSQVESAVN